MTIQAVAAGDPHSSQAGSVPTSPLPHPVVLGLISGGLLWLSFPPAEWSWAAWFALAPLFLLVESKRTNWSLYLASWMGGLAFWLLAIHWIWATDPTAWLGWIVMALFLSLWWPGFLFLARYTRKRLKLPIMIAAPVIWVALEYIRAYALTGFPWYYLAHSQYRFVYITQIADFSGSLGLSFLIAMINAFWVDLLTRPIFRAKATGWWWRRLPIDQKARFLVVLISLGGTLGYGYFRISTSRFRPGPRVALLQSNEIQEYNSDQKKSSAKLQALYESLVGRASSSDPRPDLIIWPETSFPYRFVMIDPTLDEKTLDEHVKKYDPEEIGADLKMSRDRISAYFISLMDSLRIPMIVGASLHDIGHEGYSRYNSALLLQHEKQLQTYRKLHLVPFGEYVPLVEQFPWLLRLTPYRGTRLRFLDFGKNPEWFELGPYRLATAICFEDTVPQVVRRFFAEAPDARQPDLLVNLSNDGWFHQTSEHEMHLAVSTFRCIENRVPLARAVNTGVSAMVDGNGRIIASLGKLKEGVLTEVAPLDDRTSLYSTWGDWLGQSCLACTIGFMMLGTFSRRDRPDSTR
ncbi:apolipoprotein N-acyltransferase [Tundrisphaera lichenicola]|uniref:apolipoprotein N-acyltransferase n=1 Tax=Tundrisphaera lichenicola TaxID=2029860 RepID=UPI003EBEAC12